MSEMLKFDKNGQWSLDKAQIIDMKSKKTLANLPSPDVGKRPKLGLMGAAKPKVHEPDTSSEHTDPSLNPGLGGKHGKIHGGDPRKPKDEPAGSVERIKGKPRQRISGASDLRREYMGDGDLTDARREKHPVRKCEELLDQMIEVLEKSVYNAGTHPAKGYVPGKKQSKDAHAEYDPKYSFKDNRELVRMHHQDHKVRVKREAHLDSLTRAAAKRGGHSIKE